MIVPAITASGLILCDALLGGAGLPIQLRNALAGFHAEYHISGTLQVVTNEQEFVAGVGLANDMTKKPNDANTIFLIASNTKHIVAAAILKLEEQGKLSVTDPVEKFFPEYPAENLRIGNGAPMTLENLLHLTNGLPEAFGSETFQAKLFKEPITFADILSGIKNKPLTFSPGSKWEYSDTGYLLLGEVIRRVAKMSFADFVQKNLFVPLGLKNTSVGPPKDSTHVARSYIVEANGRSDLIQKNKIVELHVTDVFTDSNIFTTASDLTVWLRSLIEGKVLTDKSLKKMLTPSKASLEINNPYGYALNLSTDSDGRKFYLHRGMWLGYESFIAIYPTEGVSVIWLGNQDLGQPLFESFYKVITSHALAH